MFAKKSIVLCIAVFVLLSQFELSSALPSIGNYGKRFDPMGGIDFIQMCLNNCMQCRKLFGDYFGTHSCADACLKFKGKALPDCEELALYAPYFNTLA